MTDAPILLRDDADGIATLTLNRPQARNSLSSALLKALRAAFADIAADESVRVVVLAANGPAFCAGHDLKELRAANYAPSYTEELFTDCAELMQAIVRLPKPVIAQIHGIATAAGAQLVASSIWRWRPRSPASSRRASISACSARPPWWRCRATWRPSTPCRCC